MKKIIFVVLVLQSVFFYAQQMGQGRGGQNQGAGDQKPPTFNASDVSGIFYYEIEEVISKIKVKDEEKEYQVSKALRKYNDKIKEISFLNSKNFEQINLLVNAMLNSSQKAPKGIDEKEKVDVKAILEAVRKEVRLNEEKLNKAMEEILSSKQNKKWLKYQKKQKRSLLPKRPAAGNGSSRGSMGGSGSGGPAGMNNGMRR